MFLILGMQKFGNFFEFGVNKRAESFVSMSVRGLIGESGVRLCYNSGQLCRKVPLLLQKCSASFASLKNAKVRDLFQFPQMKMRFVSGWAERVMYPERMISSCGMSMRGLSLCTSVLPTSTNLFTLRSSFCKSTPLSFPLIVSYRHLWVA